MNSVLRIFLKYLQLLNLNLILEVNNMIAFTFTLNLSHLYSSHGAALYVYIII